MFGSFLRNRPASALAAFCALQAVVWTFAPAYTHDSPPLDVVESTMWGREWALATYKHPAFPSWVLESLRWLTGATGWPAYLASQLCIALTFALVYRIGRDLFGADENAAEKSLAGVMLLAGVFYFSWPTPEFNHNIAQMPFYAAIILLTWRATTRDGLLWWALLGLTAGFGLHIKYGTALVGIVAALWIMLDGPLFRRLGTPGPWLALALAVVVAAPQAVWLVNHDYLPIEYARSRSGHPLSSVPYLSLAAVLAAHGGLLLMAALSGLFGRGALTPESRMGAREMRFLLLFALGPIVLTLSVAALMRVGTRDMWLSPMADLSGLLLVALTAGRWNLRRQTRLAAIAFGLLLALPVAYAYTVDYAPRLAGTLLRTAWPEKAIARRMHRIWSDATHAPLRIVAGNEWIAGLVGVSAPENTSILTNGEFRLSPWIDAERLAREGALIVWSGERPTNKLARLIGDLPQGVEEFAIPGFPAMKPVRVHYAILPPGGSGQVSRP